MHRRHSLGSSGQDQTGFGEDRNVSIPAKAQVSRGFLLVKELEIVQKAPRTNIVLLQHRGVHVLGSEAFVSQALRLGKTSYSVSKVRVLGRRESGEDIEKVSELPKVVRSWL